MEFALKQQVTFVYAVSKQIICKSKAELVLSDEIVELIVDLILPDIIAFFETEEGKKEFEKG